MHNYNLIYSIKYTRIKVKIYPLTLRVSSVVSVKSNDSADSASVGSNKIRLIFLVFLKKLFLVDFKR